MSHIIDANTGELIREAEMLTLRFMTARLALANSTCKNGSAKKEATRIIIMSSLRLVEISGILISRRILKRQECEDMINVNCIVFFQKLS
jgi:hypothetical protein